MSAGIISEQHTELLKSLCRIAEELQMPIYLIGGVVRDLLADRALHDVDIDLTVAGDALSFADTASRVLRGELKQFPRFLTAKVTNPAGYPLIGEVDFASCRTEVYEQPGGLPVVQLATLREDLQRRDFTVNAIAMPVAAILDSTDVMEWRRHAIDQFGGLDDLKKKQLRVLHDKSFLDDPTRMFRAVRYEVRLTAELEQGTYDLLQAAVAGSAVRTISKQRVFRELQIICEEAAPDAVFRRMRELDILDETTPFCRWGWESIILACTTLHDFWPLVSQSARRAVGVATFYRYANTEGRDREFIDFGMSKKQVAAIRSQHERAEELGAAEGTQLDSYSTEDLLLGLIISEKKGTAGAIHSELTRRVA